MNERIRILDFESTGEPGPEAGLCEIAYTDIVASGFDLVGEPCGWEVVEGKSRLCNPGVPIPPETAAVHHILDEDVAGLPQWQPLLASLIRSGHADEVIAYAAHGAKFESQWISPAWWTDGEVLPMVDTYKSALRLWQDAPLHSNMGLRYWRQPAGLDRQKALPAHRAGPDSYVTAFHLRDMLNGDDAHSSTHLDQLIEWSKVPALTLRCRIGDYRNGGKGTPWEEVDDGMLGWILKKDFDEDTVFTVHHHLALRAEQSRLEAEDAEINRQLVANGLQAMTPDVATAPPPADPNQGMLL